MRYQPGMIVRETYELEALIGTGASGEVWKANDNGTIVAIKFMNESLLHGDKAQKHRQRLEREIYALGLLNHPNIPKLHDFDLDFERPFVVMEYISSPTFEYLLSSGEMLRTPVTERLRILGRVADALTAAHEAGIIHRDIKPGNMNGIDVPYLLDFSVALEEESLEHTNFNVGTTIYMTPGGETPDRIADNYSFALVAYEVLFGEHPLFPKDDESRNMGTYSRILAFNRLKADDWAIPSRLAPKAIPYDLQGADFEALDRIFRRAFGDRDARYVNLQEFIDDLVRAILNEKTYDLIADMPKHIEAHPQEFVARDLPTAQSFTLLEVEGKPEAPAVASPLPAASDSKQPRTDLPVTTSENSLVNRLKKALARLTGGSKN